MDCFPAGWTVCAAAVDSVELVVVAAAVVVCFVVVVVDDVS